MQVKETLAKKEKLLHECQTKVVPNLLDEKQNLLEQVEFLETQAALKETEIVTMKEELKTHTSTVKS